MLFWLLQDVPNKESLEDCQVPHVDKEDADTANTVEDAGLVDKVEDALIVHPEDDQDPHEERDDVDVGIDPVLQGERVGVGDDVQDPRLVGDGVQLGDQGEDGEPDGLGREEGPGKGGNDGDVVDGEQGEVTNEDHVQRLRDVDAEAEHDQVHRHLRGAVHEVRAESEALLERDHGEDSRDAGRDPGQEGGPPLVRPLGAGPDVGGDPGEQEDGAQQLAQGTHHQQLGGEADVANITGDGGVKQRLERAGEESFHC